MSGPPADGPRRRARQVPRSRRIGSWLAWWVVLLGFWVAVDDSIGLAEAGAGAGAAALGAFVAEAASHQAAARLRLRREWLLPVVKLPGQVARDTAIVFAALWKRLLTGEQPPSGFRELPARFGNDTEESVTRRVLLVGANSLAPNTFVLGVDEDRDIMVVHQLVVNQGRPAQ